MMSRTYWMAFLLALIGLAPWMGVQAQTGTPVIRSFTVDQVPELVPGTELIFRVGGTAGGSLQLDIDGVASPLGLTETSAGMYAGAYTISIRDKVRHDSRVLATLRFDGRQATVALGQTLLTAEAHARASAPVPAPVQISRLETRNTGALTGGHVISFFVDATPGGLAMVSLDGGKSTIPLTEERTGRYSGRYTVKTRDHFSDNTQAQFSLILGDKTLRAAKPLGSGAVTPVAQAAPVEPPPACEGCGVVVSVDAVKVKGTPNYVGAIAGGVAGAALGNQIGKGDGRTLATVLGAVGGAVAGREVEKQVRADTRYDLTVKLDNGTTRVVSYDTNPGLAVGTKVRFDGDLLRVRD